MAGVVVYRKIGEPGLVFDGSVPNCEPHAKPAFSPDRAEWKMHRRKLAIHAIAVPAMPSPFQMASASGAASSCPDLRLRNREKAAWSAWEARPEKLHQPAERLVVQHPIGTRLPAIRFHEPAALHEPCSADETERGIALRPAKKSLLIADVDRPVLHA